jgi:glycosyltransferase involved in cell wall biosynthesis
MNVRVSILLPTLNRRSCLDERIKSIVTQTLADWEVVAVDSHSDDGTWEALQRWAAKDSRVRPFQAPRGLYGAWNRAIELARGEFVYIAASDDSMSPDFLETLVTGLGEHPECDLAHCKLRIVDGSGNPHPVLSWDRFYSTLYFGELIDKRHIRLAPHDGLLHCGVRTVYTAASQILVRRALFRRIGGFRTDFGPLGDYEWGMRASLVANTLHIPLYLATWRLHEGQATEFDRIDSAAYFSNLLGMMRSALATARKIVPQNLRQIRWSEVSHLYWKERLQAEFLETKTRLGRWMCLCRYGLGRPAILKEYWKSRKRGMPLVAPGDQLKFSRGLLDRYGWTDNIVVLDSLD